MGGVCSSVQVVERRRHDAPTSLHPNVATLRGNHNSRSSGSDENASERPRIVITNVYENEVVTHPLVLLEGRVEHQSLSGVSQRTSSAVQYIQVSAWLMNDSHFKAFVLLPEPGRYELLMHVTSATAQLSICFAPPHAKCVVRFHYQKPWDSNQGFDAPPGVDNSDNAAVDRLKLGALLLQTAFAELLRRSGGTRRTFALELGDDGLPLVHVLRSQFSSTHARVMDDDELLMHLRQDVLRTETPQVNQHSSANSGDEQVFVKHVVILGGTHFDLSTREMFDHRELADGNLVVVDSCRLHAWPRALSELTASCLDATRFQLHRTFPRGCVTGGRGGGCCWSTFASSSSRLLQLLGSSFGLEQQRDGVMRTDFRALSRLFAVFEPATPSPVFSRPIGDGRFAFLDIGAVMEMGSSSDVTGDSNDESDGLCFDDMSVDALIAKCAWIVSRRTRRSSSLEPRMSAPAA